MVKLEIVSKLPFMSGHSFFWCVVIPIGPHSVYTTKGPKGFVNCFFKKSDHECWTIKSDHEKKASSMV